jgi:two-component system response regulator DesR
MVRIIVAMAWEKERKRVSITLDSDGELEVVGAAPDCYRALRLVESEQPDVILLDYHLGSMKGWDLIPVIKRKAPGISVIIISPYDDEGYAWNALLKGASAYLIRKTDMGGVLTSTIRLVHDGGEYISKRILTRILSMFFVYRNYYRKITSMKKGKGSGRLEQFIKLSPTERQIIWFIYQGKTTKEIAETLNLKPGTVRNYISRLIQKTGGHSRTQMALSTLANGFWEFGLVMDNPPPQVYHAPMEAADENPVRNRPGNPKL